MHSAMLVDLMSSPPPQQNGQQSQQQQVQQSGPDERYTIVLTFLHALYILKGKAHPEIKFI